MALTAYLDAFSGIAGDMLVGALADAGADRQTIIRSLESLNTGAAFEFESVKRAGIAATKFHVRVEAQNKHRHLSHIVKMIESAELSDRVKHDAVAVFRKLAEAEAECHQTSIEKVHFHEVGAADSIADIVGTCVALDQLGITQLICSAINVGSGTVETEHGTLPVPAPATARLLTNAPVYSSGPTMELATPTGAAVVATLAERFGVMPPMKISRTGHGAGSRDFPKQPNVLRVILGTPVDADEALTVSVIEANIDDMNPQVLAYATERLLEAGALDVTLSPLVMKKGRPGNLLCVIATPETRESLARIIFAETTTLGLRFYNAERRVQSRTWIEVETRYGAVRVKVSGDGQYTPEYEDCRKLAAESGAALKDVLAEAGYEYLNLSR